MLNKLLIKLKRKLKMSKIVIGKEYWVVVTPKGLLTSGGVGTNYANLKNKVKVKVTGNNPALANTFLTMLLEQDGVKKNITGGWYYEYELKEVTNTIEDIDSDINILKEEITKKGEEIKALEIKKEFMITMNIDSFDEEAFKAYQVLKVLGIDDFDKAKQITKILSN